MTPAEERDFSAQLTAALPEVRSFCINLARGDHAGAEDLIQDTMLKAWAARDSFTAGTNIRAWLYIIARNHRYSQVRRRRFHGGYVDDLPLDMLPSGVGGQEARVQLTDALRALEALPAKQAAAVAAVAMGESYEHVAEAAGVPVGTIKSRTTRGRAAIVEAVERMPRPQQAATEPPPAIVVAPVIEFPGGTAPARPVIRLARLRELVATHGGASPASRVLGVDPQCVLFAIKGKPMPPRLRRALDEHIETEALAA